MSEERFDRIEQRLDRLGSGQNELRADVSGLRTDVADFRRTMDVLHADLIARIDAIAVSRQTWPTKADMAELREMIEQIGSARGDGPPAQRGD